MLTRHCFLIFIICISFLGHAQDEYPKKSEKLAKKAFKNEDYHTALPFLLQIFSADSQNVELNFRLGICYFNLGQKQESVPYFQFVKSHRKPGEFHNTEYFLGEAYHFNHEFDKAIAEFQEFMKEIGSSANYDKELIAEIKKNIRNCEVGKALAANPVKCIIRNAGSKINTVNDETHPVTSPDGKLLYFSGFNVEHEDHQKDKKAGSDPGDIFSSKDINGNFSRPLLLSFNLHSEFLDAPLFISEDGNKIYYLSISENRAQEIFYSEYINGDWLRTKPLGAPFNSEANETGFTLTEDGNTAFFSSDRAGGYGGQDLYMVKKDERGNWGKAINLGPVINSSYSEEAPHVSPDGRTLYFSCNGPNSIGGFDIFKTTKLSDTSWSQPQNLGFPINSAEDEKYLTLYKHGYKGYYNTRRSGNIGGQDIYFIQIIDTSLSPAQYLTFYQDETLFEEAMVKPDTGKHLKEIVYFDFNSSKVADFSHKKLDRVLLFLNTFPDIKLEIQGYTDNKGTDEGNHIVSERRAKAIFAYLVSKGVNPNRLKPVGYAAEHPVSHGNSEMDHARNRRVEFKVLPTDYTVNNSKYTGNYYLVKGTFSNKTNAQRLKEKLNTEGGKAFILEPDGINKFYRVVIGQSDTYEEAHEMLERLKTKEGDSVWLLSF